MRDKAQLGTRAFALLLCVVSTGCGRVNRLDSDAGTMLIPKQDAGFAPSHAGSGAHVADAGAPDASCRPLPCPSGAPWNAARCACVASDAGAAVAAECNADSDCGLALRGCCGGCLPPSRDDVLAVPKSKLADVQRAQCPNPVNCGACYVSDPDPLAPLMAAACVAQRCELVDLRSAAISTCVENIDCIAVGRGCCPPSSASPSEYVGIHTGADAGILMCSPTPPCLPPEPHADPLPFCAADGHCAVRRRETSKGTVSFDCFSPTQNLERAYDRAAVGCDCEPFSMSVCRKDQTGRRVALICEGNDHWVAAEDGPCQP
jgi:hypothetical protein